MKALYALRAMKTLYALYALYANVLIEKRTLVEKSIILNQNTKEKNYTYFEEIQE